MQTLDVPRHEWREQLDDFTRAHEGALVSVDVLGTELGVQPEVRRLPLVGVWWDRPSGSVAVAVASSIDDQLTHVIGRARGIYIERTDGGDDTALEIQSDDGTTTLVTLRAAPEGDPVTGFILR